MAPGSAKRPGRLRRILFWVHLSCGVGAGLVILMMSVTGVLLTYERQILASAERSASAEASSDAPRPSLDGLLAAPLNASVGPPFDSVTVARDDRAPLLLRAGRRERLWLDPATGEPVADPAGGLREFFAAITALHRWFAVDDANRDAARSITGAANLVFLFLAVSGLFLWLPQAWRWFWVRSRIWFRRRYATAKARDYNWHHVLGFWCAVPLIVITATGSVFYYPWANDLVYRAVGDTPPARAERGQVQSPAADADRAPVTVIAPLQALFESAAAAAGDWNTLTLSLPEPGVATVSVRVDRGNGGQPHLTETLTLDRQTAAVVAREPFEARAPGSRARSIVRFLHTGEVFGPVGQTVAGLASLAGALLVWTGLALAYRRLVQPLLRRRPSRSDAEAIDST